MFKRIRRLEERIVYDAAVAAAVVDGMTLSEGATDIEAESAESSDAFSTSDPHSQDAAESANPIDAIRLDAPPDRLVVLSSDVPDVETLANALSEDATVIVYDPSTTTLSDLYAQIETSVGSGALDSIAFIGHGDANEYHLTDGAVLSLDSLSGDQGQINFWSKIGDLVAADGRVDLLGCNLAESAEGLQMIQLLESITDANVAASIDITANESEGGNWILETDNVDAAATYFNQAELAMWNGSLAIFNVDAGAIDEAVDSDGLLSLREAIVAANTNGESDTINLPSGTTALTLGGFGEGDAMTGDLDIRFDGGSTTIIQGAVDNSSVVDASALGDRVFEVRFGATAEFRNVHITGGTEVLGEGGGGIFSQGVVTLFQSRVSGNSTDSSANQGFFPSHGGGIYSVGTLTVNQSTITDNTATGDGGGIYSSSQVDEVLSLSTLTVFRSTIDNNEAEGSGGGVWSDGNVDIRNSTISTNRSVEGSGGGIFVEMAYGGFDGQFQGGDGPQQQLTLIHNTIAFNTTTGFEGSGGGVHVNGLAQSCQDIRGNIISNNSSIDVNSEVDSDGHNLIGDGSLSSPQGSDLVNTDPGLGPLAVNGGLNSTHAITTSSPAYNTSDNGLNPLINTVDERGVARDTLPDRGAFEIVINEEGEEQDPYVLHTELDLTEGFAWNPIPMRPYVAPTYVGWVDLSFPSPFQLVDGFLDAIIGRVFGTR